jgi:hypothetical protein
VKVFAVVRCGHARIGATDNSLEAHMAADVNTGMEKQDMKRLLMKSKKEPVNCAVGQGEDASTALLLLDKVKQGKAVEMELHKQFPSAKNTRFGTAEVDMDLDPKEVRLTINKPAAGIARKLVKTLKGTGFTKVVIVSADDGSVLEQAGEEEGPAAAPQDAAATAAPPQDAAAPAVPPPSPQHDAAALLRALTELVKRMPPVLAATPALKAPLAQLAADANGNLKASKLAEAAASIEALRRALDGAAPAAAPQGAAAAPEAAKALYEKSRAAWLAARKKIETDIEKLRAEIVATYQEGGQAPELDKRYRARVAPLLAMLDGRLADKLAEAGNAADPAQHAKLAAEAKGIIGEYTAYVASETLIADLDANPFVPLALKATVSATLAAVSKAVA